MQPTVRAEDWRTKAETTGYKETPRYDETMAYCRRLAGASEFVHLETIGRSPEGRDILAVIVSTDKAFTPEAARATGKEIVLVNCCIHPGESEGKDASLALLRDLVVNGDGTRARRVVGARDPARDSHPRRRWARTLRPVQPHQPERPRRDGLAHQRAELQPQPRLGEGRRARDARGVGPVPPLAARPARRHPHDRRRGLPVRPDVFAGEVRQPGSGGRRLAKGSVRRAHLSRPDKTGS